MRRLHVSPRVLVVGAGLVVLALVAAVLVPRLTSGPDGPAWTVPSELADAHVVIGDRMKGGVELVADNGPGAVSDTASAARVARDEQALSIALLQEVAKEQAGAGNVSVSPASLEVALAMLQNGAAGTTLTQMQKALRAADLTTAEQNTGLASLVDEWQESAKASGITLDSASSLFVQHGFPLRAGFLSALGSSYDAGVWEVDFANQLSQAIGTINAWTSEHTHGKITKLFDADQLDGSTVAVLANAVYFKAAWDDPFDPAGSHPMPFAGPSGQTNLTFMTKATDTLPWEVGSDYQAVQLPYRGHTFDAVAIMPTAGTLDQLVATMTPAKLAGVVAALHTGAIQLALPKFTTRSTLSLQGTLSALGMPSAFTAAANFSALSTVPTRIQAVQQRVYLAVGEKGTEAAAATGVMMAAGGAAPVGTPLVFDHPFLFLLRDSATGAILFASLVRSPTN